MKYTLTLQTDDIAELTDALDKLNSDNGTAYAVAAGAEQADKPKRTRRTKAQIEADAAKAAGTDADGQPNPPAETKAETEAAALDYAKDVRPKIMEASQSKDVGMEKVVELLAKYGAKRGQDIPVEKLPAFLADLTKLGQPAESKADDDGDGDIF